MDRAGPAFASALVTNTAYSFEHDAAVALPPLSPRRPFRTVQFLIDDPRWLKAFGTETAGWLLYVAALRLAPLALVQSVTASGVAVLAFVTARGHPSRLARREQAAVVLALIGLVLLGLSITGAEATQKPPAGPGPHRLARGVRRRRGLLIVVHTHIARAASLGLATGLLFSIGDISAKLIGYGGMWLVALVSLIIGYGIGTSVLQSAYQKGDVLTAAGTATVVTNAVPIVAASSCSARPCRTVSGPSPRSRRSAASSRARSPSGARMRRAQPRRPCPERRARRGVAGG